jgi:hypothetical protein
VASFAPDDQYNFGRFVYDDKSDTYTCPEGQTLTTNGAWYVKSNYGYHVKHYKTSSCSTCPAMTLCTKNKKGRLIERSEYQPFVELNKQNIEKNPATYKRRQAIVEHTYGIIKRQWGYYFVSTKKGMRHASADVGLMFTALNLRRLMNILDNKVFKKFLEELALFLVAEKVAVNSFLASARPYFRSVTFTYHKLEMAA